MASSFTSYSVGLPVDLGASSDLDLDLDLDPDPDHLLVSFEDPTHHEVQPPSKNQYLTDHFDGGFQGHSLPTGGMNEVSLACTCRNTNATIRRINNNNHTTSRQSGHRKSLLPTTVPQMNASHENPPYLRPSAGIGYSTGILSRTPPSTLVSNPSHSYQCGDSYQPGSGYM